MWRIPTQSPAVRAAKRFMAMSYVDGKREKNVLLAASNRESHDCHL